MKNYIGQALSTLLLTVCLGSCNKISTEDQKSPFDFSGVESIQGSAGGSFILSWTPPKLIEIENYGVFLLALSADDAKSLIPADAKLAPDDKNPGVAVQTSPAFSPADHGKLISIVARDSNSFKTPVLDEGYYLLQVKVLAKDGRSDSSSKSILLQVRSADAFTGITLAQVDGADATLSWLPSPSIREGEKFQYTIYKGPAFNQAVGFTKDTTFSYPLNQEAAGSTIYFGVRFTDGQGQEDRNSVILPIKVPNLNDDFSGCLTATGVGSDRIRVDFQWPTSKSYQELKVFRNQREVFSSLSRSVTSFVDRELVEGEVYTYTCQAFDSTKAIMGSKAVKGSPLSSNAPTFAGIRNAAAQDGHTALLSWGVSKGVPAEAFKLYASQGPNLDWTAAPALSMEVSSLTGSITGLGDDLIYSFGVRACGALTCDPNTDQINLQMPDAGPPQSLGAESAVLDNGKILIHAPWSPKDGGISKRHIYVKVDGPSSAEIGDYTLAKTILVPAGSPVPETLVYDSIIAGKTYHLIVRDEDVHGQRNASVAFVSVVTGDLSPPEFNGISSLAVGPLLKEETTLTVNFAAIKPYTEEIKGAKTYRFYLREGSAAACNETYYKLSLPGTSFAMGPATMVLTGLKPKTFYSVCVKVVDKYNNMSTNINYAARQTQDKTKPDFDGLQTLLYDIGRSEVNLTWNSSSSADIYEYKITTWLTSSPNPVMEISIARRASESPSSYALTSGLIGFKSEDNLEVVVNACDNASTIGGGTQNCTTFDRSKALKFTFADIQPPAGFLGISSLGAQLKPAAGSIQVTWIAPSSWTDYSGFKVYKVGDAESLTLLKDCPCAGVNCPDTITSCTITDLDHYRSYPLHVRAYDAKGNHTLLDPTLSVARVRTSDTQKPSFHSNLGLDFVSGATLLDWAAATDDQYALEPGVALTYHVYRKVDSNFANLLNPSVDGLLLTDTLTLNYIDSKDFITGKTYYYTVCVTDSSLNESCDGAFKSTTIPDLVPPVIASFASSKTTAGKTWNLTWSASDNITTTPNLLYRVKYRVSNDPLAVLTDADATIFTQIGASGQLNLVGPQNVDTYIHYLLTVTDGAGNAAKKQITLYSTNKVVVGSVNMNEGSTLGGKLLY
ncbi:MAG: fibronectin type III domain-containing protein, partial [Oligoflexus sp.]|nr:fibronectin type III domain-containing protein [Oligoflexus sp.]